MTLTMRRTFCAVVALSCLLAPRASAQQPSPDAAFAIEKVVVNGLKRYTTDQVVKLSGLSTGSSVRLAELEAAARRMADTGLFNNVSYRYSTAANRVTVTLDVEEASWTMPVVFDNFVWLTEAELTAEEGQAMPTFDGTVPATDNARNHLTQTLQKALRSRNLAGTVEVVPYLNMKTRAQQYLAKVTNPSPRICAVRLSGASPAMEREVKSATDALAGMDYSRTYVIGMSAGTLLDVYHKQGYWAATVSEPGASLDTGCGGVAIALTFNEGQVYQWEGADWRGNTKLPAEALTPLLSFRAGEMADSNRIDAGVRKVRDLYGTVGHLNAGVTYTPQLIPQTQRVRFAFEVSEGPQFRMGTLAINGFSPEDAANLQKRWKLKPGDVYNTAIAQLFWREELVPLLKQRGFRPSGLELKQGSAPQTVDVTINARK